MHKSKQIYLSYFLNNETPTYNNDPRPNFYPHKSLSKGDTCNSVCIEITNHMGTHIDVPSHFIESSFTLNSYQPADFCFFNIVLIELELQGRDLILGSDLSGIERCYKADLLLIKTGFCEKRKNKEEYVFKGPGLGKAGAQKILELFPNIKAIGVDFISINSYNHKQEGRIAHMILLGLNKIILIEDMDLTQVSKTYLPYQIIVAPLLIDGADGAPATIIGFFNDQLEAS